jgi:hypothetical protein
MATTVTIDKDGRIVLPKPVLARLHLGQGIPWSWRVRKAASFFNQGGGSQRIYQKQGVWVFNSGVPLDADVVRKTILKVRRERDRHNLGKLR